MIKVIIERVLAEDMESTYDSEIRKSLTAVMTAKGYISGASYSNIDNPNIRTIITNWDNVGCWSRWHKSKTRREVNKAITLMLIQDEKIKVLMTQSL
ncbi:MAG TPA: antibiotic biosynthesis monooxygenase [Colwellia sp.]|nr:antibiotic biosynthesis monooxygenase [Colwellia sp.]